MKKLLVLFVCVLLLLCAVAAPAVAARPAGGPELTPAQGTWSWVVNEKSIKATDLPDGNQYVTGYEIGTWNGTFAGTAREPFEAMFIGKNGLWATLTINFVGKVAGVSGKMTMLVMAYAPNYPDDHPVAMNGSWWIQNGHGRLHDLHGAGTWTTYLDNSPTSYTGNLWRE
jgi:hypothetical protein